MAKKCKIRQFGSFFYNFAGMKEIFIDKRKLDVILSDQKTEIDTWQKESLCARNEKSLVDLNSPQAQVVVGVRRSGKSTLCMQALIDSGVPFAYVNFDDERLAGLSTSQLNDVLEVLYKIYGDFQHVFFDEIQNIDGWPLFVNRLLRTKMHVVLTGSNAKLLSTDLATHLTGRSSEIALFPFSFAEFLALKKVSNNSRTTKDIAKLRNAFDEYLHVGGFPELMNIKNEKKYITDLVNNILKRDIEQRYKIVYPAQFERLAHHLLNIVPCVVSSSELAKLFDIRSIHTIRNYIKYLKEAYLLIEVQKYSKKSKLRTIEEKVYAVDVAFMNQRENTLSGDNFGWRLETIVLLQIVRKCKNNGWDVFYIKNRSGECDFAICDGNKVIQCIQVSYDISSEKTRKREINGLLFAHKETGCTNLLLLTDHDYADVTKDGLNIKIRPVCEWSTQLSLYDDATSTSFSIKDTMNCKHNQ